MAKDAQAGKETVSIKDFSFDGGNSLFDSFGGTAKPIKQDLSVLDDDDDDLETSTNLEEKGKEGEEEETVEVTEGDFNFDNKPPKKGEARKAPAQMTGEEDDEEEVKAEPKKETKKSTQKAEEVEEDDEEEDEVVVDDDKSGTEVDEKLLFTSLAQGLKEKGVFKHVEIEDGAELTEEEYIELHELELDARADSIIDELFKGVSDTAKDFIKHLKSGGSEADFMQGYVSEIDLEGINTDEAEDRKRLLVYYLTAVDDLDAEEVQDRLDWLKSNGKDKATADKYLKALKAADSKRKEDFKALKAASDKKRESNIKEFNDGIKGIVEQTEQVGAFPLTKEDKKDLPSYITKATIKVDDKYAPPFQVDLSKILRAKTEKDKQNLILLAKLVKSNFDVTDLIPAVETKVTKKAKSILEKVKKGSVKAGTSGSYSKKSLADYFGE